MNKESKISINNLVYALLFLIFGIILLTSTEDLITIVSKVIGSALIIVGIIKSIIYIYMKGKVGDYSISKLVIGILLISFGTLLVLVSQTISVTIRLVVGMWILFTAVNRIIFALSMRTIDKKGFLVYLITALLMLVLGVLLISGILDQLIGLLIIGYAVMEIVNYIYYKVKNKNFDDTKESVKPVKKDKKIKRLKKGKVIDAVIEE